MTLMIIDYHRTLYDPDTDALVDGAHELLTELKARDVLLVLVSRREGERDKRIQELGISSFFDEVLFVEDKTEQVFRYIRSRYPGQFC